VNDEVPQRPGSLGPGSRLAGYQIGEELGRGGMAVVYRAYDPRLERHVALKILAPGLASDEAFRQRFIRESRTAAAVDHPHIIPVFEAGEANGFLFIAMRLVGSGDVQTLIDEQGPLPPGRACAIVTQVASALDAAHARGLVHRDVKPANMLLGGAGSGEDDHVYLSDFGLSKRALGSTDLTSAGQFLGTLNYVAPEQIEGRPVDGRTDLYALACSAYAMLAGSPPFGQEESAAIMWAQLSTTPPPVSSRRPQVPAAADAVLARALAKTPAERYPTCGEFAAALRQACGVEPGGAPPVQSRPAPREPTRAVPPAQLAAAAAVTPPAPASPAHPPTAAASAPATGTGIRGAATGGAATGGAATGGAATGGAATRVVPGPAAGRPRGPGGTLRESHPAPGQPRRRRSRRVKAAAAVAAVAVLAAAGGYVLLAGGSGGSHASAAALLPPACSPALTARAGTISGVPHRLVRIGGHPFGVAATRGYAFATNDGEVAVLATAHATPALL
jgi:hypothetical protein